MRPLPCLVLALTLAAPLAFSTGCSAPRPPANSADEFASDGPPVGWRDPSLGKETNSPPMIATGLVVVSIAATLLPIGSLVASNSGQDCVSDPTGANFTCTPGAGRITGLGILAAAAGGLAVGIPLIVLGAEKVPMEIPRRAALTVGPAGAAFRYDF